jgi:glycosyltransferase involved in cell wall biosynthesis
VLFLFTEVFATGGIQRFNQTILDACQLLGIDATVLALHDSSQPTSPRAVPAGWTFVGFSGNRHRFAFAAARAFLGNRFDRVLIGHVNFLVLASVFRLLAPMSTSKTLLIAHGIEVWQGIGAVLRLALGRLDRILCVSRYTRQRILDQAPGLRPDRLIVFPNALAERWGVEKESVVARPLPARFLLSVTRLEPGDRYKGIANVIEALSMVEDMTLEYLVIGHGRDVPFLERVAERWGVRERVHFLKGITDSELIRLYRSCQSFVLPSGKEGFGIVFLEAMYFGAPVIAAHEKGATDVVRDGETGLAIRFGDTIAIHRAIERLGSDRQLRERLCAAGRALVVDDGPFTFASFTQRCAEILEIGTAHAAWRGRVRDFSP